FMCVIGNPYVRGSVFSPAVPAVRAPEEAAVQLTPEGVLRLDGSCVAPAPQILDPESRRFNRLDAAWLIIWLLFLLGLAVLPPQLEWHKQLILLAIGIVQLLETKLISHFPTRGVFYVILLKILLATLLLDHTEEVGINSSYYPIYYLPVVTAALYCGTWLTLLWTLLASAAYCSYLYPAMQEYELTPEAIGYLALRILFFFLAAMVVNRFSQQSLHQTQLYRDLAERLAETNRRLEHAQAEARRSERLAALGQLSAGLAHEIRNPLGVIKGSAEMLTQKLQASDELARELAGYISTEVNRLSALVTEFLDFARPLHAEPHPADLTGLLDRVLQIVAERFAGKQLTGAQETGKSVTGKSVRVERHYASGLPLVPLDESLCEQAFLNLVQNAYEAMQDDDDAHGGTLRVEVRPTTLNDCEGVELRLADTGPGVPDELREEIFNPFVTTKKTGVGLGLSIVSKIVDGHHGSIHVENGPGGGAVFTLFFPLDEGVEPQATAELRSAWTGEGARPHTSTS
ncbi:MAG TPA: ATP-binding protein, partial [Terriglobales bacterium]|nr:ATP-binding protein [Terriglobales bacterium]